MQLPMVYTLYMGMSIGIAIRHVRAQTNVHGDPHAMHFFICGIPNAPSIHTDRIQPRHLALGI